MVGDGDVGSFILRERKREREMRGDVVCFDFLFLKCFLSQGVYWSFTSLFNLSSSNFLTEMRGDVVQF